VNKNNDDQLDLFACIRIALAENPLSQAAEEGISIADAGVGIAKSPYYPNVSLTGGYRYWETHAFLPGDLSQNIDSPVIGPTNDWTVGIKASYILSDNGARTAKLRTALAQKGIAEEEASRMRLNIAFDVQLKFYAVVSVQEARKVAIDNLTRSQELLRVAKLKESVGTTTHADVVQAQVEVANAKLELVRAKRTIQINQGSLNTTLGLPVEQKLKLVFNNDSELPLEEEVLPKLLEKAIYSRPEIKSALHRIGAAENSIGLARSAFGPNVNIQGAYGYRDSEFLPEDQDWSVGLALEFPVFKNYARTNKLTGAEHSLLIEEANIRQIILQIKEEVWKAYQKLNEALEAIETSKVLVKDARENLQLSKQRYNAGISTMNELLGAQTSLARSELIAVEYYWQYFIAKATLDHSTGNLTERF
jgi:outer membrane protein TolC